MLLGDVNGDEHLDLVAGKSREKLNIFLGQSGRDLLARTPQTMAVPLPDDERKTMIVDLNRDKQRDLLIHHARFSAPQRLILLIAK